MASPQQPCNQPFYAFYQVPVEHFALWPPGPFTSGCFPNSLFLHYSSLHFSHVLGIHWLLTFPSIFTSSILSLLQMPSCSGDYQNQVLWNQPRHPQHLLSHLHTSNQLGLLPSSILVQATFSVFHDHKPSSLSEWEKWHGTFGHQRNYLNCTDERRQEGSNSHCMQLTGQVAIKCMCTFLQIVLGPQMLEKQVRTDKMRSWKHLLQWSCTSGAHL